MTTTTTKTTAKMTTKTRHLGHCQICDREQKLARGVLVHHGYRRPGSGRIRGTCYGVASPPYELSCELLKKHLPNVQVILQDKRDFLTRLENRQIPNLVETRLTGETVEYVCGITSLFRWEEIFKRWVTAAKDDIYQLEREIARIERRIANWKPMPVRSVDE
jgi:hypothetical protein